MFLLGLCRAMLNRVQFKYLRHISTIVYWSCFKAILCLNWRKSGTSSVAVNWCIKLNILGEKNGSTLPQKWMYWMNVAWFESHTCYDTRLFSSNCLSSCDICFYTYIQLCVMHLLHFFYTESSYNIYKDNLMRRFNWIMKSSWNGAILKKAICMVWCSLILLVQWPQCSDISDKLYRQKKMSFRMSYEKNENVIINTILNER